MIQDKKYCLVKYLHWETTKKHLDCSKCPCDCIHSGKHNTDELLPTKPPETKGAVKK